MGEVKSKPLSSKSLWSSDPDPDDMLMPLAELSVTLRKRYIIDRNRTTLYLWATRGLKTRKKRGPVILTSLRVGNTIQSSVRFVKEFLCEQSETS